MIDRFAFIGDVHVGNHSRAGGQNVAGLNSRCRDVVHALQLALTTLEQGTTAIVLGDLFDTHRPSPQQIAAVRSVFREHVDRGQPPVIVIVGNHDQRSSAAGDHALAPLDGVADVVERAEVRDRLVLLPYRSGDPAEVLREDVSSLSIPEGAIYCAHVGIRSADSPFYLKDSGVSVQEIDEITTGRRLFVSGDWHEYRRHSPDIIQQGALVPTGWDNEGIEGYGVIGLYDGSQDTLRTRTIPGPRFVTVYDTAALDLLSKRPDAVSIFARWLVPSDQIRSATETAQSYVDLLASCVVEADTKGSSSVASGIADSVRHEDRLCEALAEFIRQKGYNRSQDVLRQAQHYLKGSQSV